MTSPTQNIPFEQTKDRQVNDLQRKINDYTSVLRNGPFGSGNARTGIVIPYDPLLAPSYEHPTTDEWAVVIDHGLGRDPIGAAVIDLVADLNTAPVVTRVPDESLDSKKQMLVQSSVACIVSLWVY